MLPAASAKPYPEEKMAAARAVGCRVAFYTDIANAKEQSK